MIGYRSIRRYRAWVWGFGIDRHGAVISAGPFSLYLIWRKAQ